MNSVSVIIPTWNRAYFIERAINSALNQTLSPLEVLVCDDGSTDDTKELVLSIKDQRVRWIPGDRGGRPAIPRNRGIKKAKGEWLAFLDSDDEWLPDKLEKQLKLVKELNCKAVSSNAFRFTDKGIQGNVSYWKKEKLTFSDILNDNHVICSSAVFHKSLLEKVIGFPEGPEFKAIEDYTLWLRIISLSDFAYVNESLVIYHDDPLNSVRTAYDDQHQIQKQALKNFLEWANTQEKSDLLGSYIYKAKNHYDEVLKSLDSSEIKG